MILVGLAPAACRRLLLLTARRIASLARDAATHTSLA